MPADYDGDGEDRHGDLSAGDRHWVIRHSSTGTTASYVWGRGTDTPVPGDYDGDGVADLAVYRPSTGVWYVLTSGSSYDPSTAMTITLGAGTDIPGAGRLRRRRHDRLRRCITRRPRIWTVLSSSSAGPGVHVPVGLDRRRAGARRLRWRRPRSTSRCTGRPPACGSSASPRPAAPRSLSCQLGLGTDMPVPGDYDGDGMTDLAVYRPATGEWFVAAVDDRLHDVGDVPVGLRRATSRRSMRPSRTRS